MLTSLAFPDPSLLTSDEGARDHPQTTSYPTPDSAPAQLSTRDPLIESPSSPEEAQGQHASGALDKPEPPQVEEPRVTSTTHGSSRCDENDFDAALREIDEVESAYHPPHALPRPSDRMDDPESSIRSPVGETHKGSERADHDEAGSSASQLKTQIFDCDDVDGRDHDIPYGALHHDTSVSNVQEHRQEVETTDTDEDTHRDSRDTTSRYDNHPPVSENPIGNPRSDQGDGTPDENYSADQTSNNCQRAQISKRTTVEDDPDESQDLFIIDDEFGDSDIEAALDDAHRFLKDTSTDRKGHPRGTDVPQVPLTPESLQANCKRKLSSAVESETDHSPRNLRPRLEDENGQSSAEPRSMDGDAANYDECREPEDLSTDDGGLEDTETQSTSGHTHGPGQDTLRLESNSENPAKDTDALIQAADIEEDDHITESPRRSFIPAGSSGSSESTLRSVEYPSHTESDAGNNRKRRRAAVSPEEDDDTSRYSPILSPRAPPDDGQIEAAAQPPLAPTEDREEVDAWSLYSPCSSRLTSPSSGTSEESEQSDEAIGGCEASEPNVLESLYSQLTSHQLSEVQRIGERLHSTDLAALLEKYSCTGKVSDFWDGPSWNHSSSSNATQMPNPANFMAYMMRMHKEIDVFDIKIRLGRCYLFLLFIKEIERERRLGTVDTALKRNAVSTLCDSRGMTPAEKRKIHKTFHNDKKIGEYWWWCVCYFGPSFLLRCSKEAGKKINNARFPLDVMIAYALHVNSPAAKPYPALDEAVVHLLVTGKFSGKFSRQNFKKWEKIPATKSAMLKTWRPFSTEAVTKDALANLNEWQANTANRLLTFEV